MRCCGIFGVLLLHLLSVFADVSHLATSAQYNVRLPDLDLVPPEPHAAQYFNEQPTYETNHLQEAATAERTLAYQAPKYLPPHYQANPGLQNYENVQGPGQEYLSPKQTQEYQSNPGLPHYENKQGPGQEYLPPKVSQQYEFNSGLPNYEKKQGPGQEYLRPKVSQQYEFNSGLPNYENKQGPGQKYLPPKQTQQYQSNPGLPDYENKQGPGQEYLPPKQNQQYQSNSGLPHYENKQGPGQEYLPPTQNQQYQSNPGLSHYENKQGPGQEYLPPKQTQQYQSNPGLPHYENKQGPGQEYLPPKQTQQYQSNPGQKYLPPQETQTDNFEGPKYLPPAVLSQSYHNYYQAPSYLPPAPEPRQHAGPQPVIQVSLALPEGYDFVKPPGAEAAIAELHTLPADDPAPISYTNTQGAKIRTVQIVNEAALKTWKILETYEDGVKTIKVLGTSNENPIGEHRVVKVQVPGAHIQTVKVFNDRTSAGDLHQYLPPAESARTTHKRSIRVSSESYYTHLQR